MRILSQNENVNEQMLAGLKAEKKVYSYIGLSARSRNLVSGEFSTEKAVKNFTACLVLVASDASDNTKKLFRNKCIFYEVPCYEFGTKEKLGHALGKEICASLAFTDEGLANAAIKQLNQEVKECQE